MYNIFTQGIYILWVSQ